MTTPKGYHLHAGTINGHAYDVIATLKSKNVKTGNMAQVWILLRDTNPVAAVKSGIDAATICRACPFASGQGCYVQVANAPLSIFRAMQRGNYPHLAPAQYASIFAGRMVRFGAYGDPSLIPLAIIKRIAASAEGWTGYTHYWSHMTASTRRAYGRYLMASTETTAGYCQATAAGLRCFHVSPVKPAGAIECLSTSSGMSCADCRLCAGTSRIGARSVWIAPHGAKRGKAAAASV
jgi:hypothetical protein